MESSDAQAACNLQSGGCVFFLCTTTHAPGRPGAQLDEYPETPWSLREHNRWLELSTAACDNHG